MKHVHGNHFQNHIKESKYEKKLFYFLICAVIIILSACANTESVGAFNKTLFDVQYSFDTAIIDLHNEVITVNVKSWTDYEDGEQLQIIAEDGTVYLTSSYNCTLIKTKE